MEAKAVGYQPEEFSLAESVALSGATPWTARQSDPFSFPISERQDDVPRHELFAWIDCRGASCYFEWLPGLEFTDGDSWVNVLERRAAGRATIEERSVPLAERSGDPGS